jgi:hypothetical protein
MLGFVAKRSSHAATTRLDQRNLAANGFQHGYGGSNANGITIRCRRSGFLVTMSVKEYFGSRLSGSG